MQHMCVCPSSETRRKRDHTEGDEGRAVTGPLLFMVRRHVSPFLGDVDCCAGFVSAQEVRASKRASRARPRMREMFF